MFKKTILFLTIFHLHSTVMSMENSSTQNLNLALITPLPIEVKKIIHHIAKKQPWWYLKQTYTHGDSVQSVCFDASGKLFLTASSDGKARIFDIEKNSEISSFDHSDKSNYVTHASFSPSGKLLVTSSSKGEACIFDVQTNNEIASFKHQDAVDSACFHSSENFIATTSGIKARLFNIKINSEIVSVYNPSHIMKSACFDPTGKLFATASHNCPIRIFKIHNVETEPFLTEIVDFKITFAAKHICFDSSGKLLAIATEQPAIHIMCTEKEIEIGHIPCEGSYITDICTDICFDPTGKLILIGSHSGAHIFDIERKTKIYSFKHNNYVLSACFNSTGTLVGTGSTDNMARVFALYENDTLEQRLLKTAFNTWILIEKPNREINTLETLFEDIALKYYDSPQEITQNILMEIWNTFPTIMRGALWRTMQYKIQKYGK